MAGSSEGRLEARNEKKSAAKMWSVEERQRKCWSIGKKKGEKKKRKKKEDWSIKNK